MEEGGGGVLKKKEEEEKKEKTLRAACLTRDNHFAGKLEATLPSKKCLPSSSFTSTSSSSSPCLHPALKPMLFCLFAPETRNGKAMKN